MSDFPTLSKNANLTGYSQSLAQDPTIVSEFANGFQIARAKYSNVPLKFELQYSFLTSSDKTLLEAFEKNVSYRAGSFNWTNLEDNLIYTVRFANNLKFNQERSSENFWSVRITLIENRPNTAQQIS